MVIHLLWLQCKRQQCKPQWYCSFDFNALQYCAGHGEVCFHTVQEYISEVRTVFTTILMIWKFSDEKREKKTQQNLHIWKLTTLQFLVFNRLWMKLEEIREVLIHESCYIVTWSKIQFSYPKSFLLVSVIQMCLLRNVIKSINKQCSKDPIRMRALLIWTATFYSHKWCC